MLSTRDLYKIIGLLVLLCGVAFFILLAVSRIAVQDELLKELGKTLLEAGVVGTIAFFAKFLLDERQRHLVEREQHKQDDAKELERIRALEEARHKYRADALNQITRNYWQVRKAFYLIAAHKSAKTYGEQVRHMIDLRVQLQQLDNDIAIGLYPIKDNFPVSDNLRDLSNVLREVIEEWKTNYLHLSQLQSQDEKRPVEEKQVPHELDRLPKLNETMKDECQVLHNFYEAAVKPIRLQLVSPPNPIDEV